MTEKPILFSDAMVRAILAGAKTQTRRPVQSPAKNMQRAVMCVIKNRAPGDTWYGDYVWSMRGSSGVWGDYMHERFLSLCPYGQPGDRLWVREAWGHAFTYGGGSPAIAYRATGNAWRADGARVHTDEVEHAASPGQRWRPSIHMPRWASRLTLEVTSVRVERVQSISEEDARAEGFTRHAAGWSAGGEGYDALTARYAFAELWDSISGEHADRSWSANPWVWCVSFKVVPRG